MPIGSSSRSRIWAAYWFATQSLRKRRSSATHAVLQMLRQRIRLPRLRTMSVDLYKGGLAVVSDPYGPPRLVDLVHGRVHALFGTAIGSGFATRDPVRGHFVPALAGKLPLRKVEVRFRSGNAVLAGTLMIPPVNGRRPTVAYVAGSGQTTREYLPELQALFLHAGIAVLAYDKRGVGGSSGVYPGESPTSDTIDVLARDAQAAVRFLAARPEVDAARVSLA